MRIAIHVAMLAILTYLASTVSAQEVVCKDGQCSIIQLVPLTEEIQIDTSTIESSAASDEDRFTQVIRATVRVTISGVCGSGTVVGRDADGNAIVLTNAHVAGTQRGRTVNLERWNSDGSVERGRGAIISSGYGRGMSVDFALLKCNAEFAKDVRPIPLADRYPTKGAMVSTYGCPRCEWPSLQVLSLNRSEGQILTWKPEAIGGRSGSSVIDYTDVGPRVVEVYAKFPMSRKSTTLRLGRLNLWLCRIKQAIPRHKMSLTPSLSLIKKLSCVHVLGTKTENAILRIDLSWDYSNAFNAGFATSSLSDCL